MGLPVVFSLTIEMKKIEIPLLTNEDGHTFPMDGDCPACGVPFKITGGFAYMSGGALLIDNVSDDSCRTSKMEAFFGIGFHGNDVDVRDSVHAQIVHDLLSDQFDICFCSLQCLKDWLNQLLDTLQSELDDKRV